MVTPFRLYVCISLFTTLISTILSQNSETNSPEVTFPSVKEILHVVSHNPGNYLVQFYSSHPFIYGSFPYENYTSCFPCTFCFYDVHFLHGGPINRSITIHTQSQSVIILFSDVGIVTLLKAWNFAYFINVVYFVYLDFPNVNKDLNEIFRIAGDVLHPATKMIVYKKLVNSEFQEVGKVICNDYCVDYEVYLSNQFIKCLVQNPVQFHKSTFWNGHARHVFAKGFGYLNYFDEYRGENRSMCKNAVGTGNDNSMASKCDAKLLAVLYLAEVHNISFEILSARIPEERNKADFSITGQFLESYVRMTGGTHDPLPLFHVSGHALAGERHYKLLYCKGIFMQNSVLGGTYQVWTTAFSWEIWLFLLVSLTTVAISLRFLRTFGYFDIVKATVGQMISNNSAKHLTHLVILSFFVRSIFENTITSLVVVPPEPVLYKNLKDMILNKRKILFDNTTWLIGLSPEEIFMPDFRQSGISQLLHDSFHILPVHLTPIRDRVKFYLQPLEGTEYAALVEGIQASIDKYVYNMRMLEERRRRDVSCYFMQQRLQPVFQFWALYMVNRHWVILTLNRMRDSGLVYLWDAWENYLNFLIRKRIFRELEQEYPSLRKVDVIDLERLYPVGLLCAGVFYAALAVFLIERCSGNCNENTLF